MFAQNFPDLLSIVKVSVPLSCAFVLDGMKPATTHSICFLLLLCSHIFPSSGKSHKGVFNYS